MHKKVLVTGANGFVARYLVSSLKSLGDEVVGVDIFPEPSWNVDKYYHCNLLEADAIRIILSVERPDAIIHLAAVSSVAQSWKTPVDSFLNNTNIFLNLVEAVRALKLKTRIISVGSSEEYGNIPIADTPIPESHPLAPCSPYDPCSTEAGVGGGEMSFVHRAAMQFFVGCFLWIDSIPVSKLVERWL